MGRRPSPRHEKKNCSRPVARCRSAIFPRRVRESSRITMVMRAALVFGGVLGMLAVGVQSGSAAVQPCPIDGNCAEVTVKAPAQPVGAGGSAHIRVAFLQGDDDQAPGGVDEIAALNLSLGIPGLELADCSAPGPNGLNAAFTLLAAAGRYRAVVQNLACASRASCLCPTNGEPRDEYV